MTTEDVVCPECENVYTVECYFDKNGYLGCHAFEYGWYEEHGDEDMEVRV